MQVTDELCTVCGTYYETGDSVDPNENENHQYGMCPKCYANPNQYSVEVFTICDTINHPFHGQMYNIGDFYIDPTLPQWKSVFKEHVTSKTALIAVNDLPKNKKIKHVDREMEMLRDSGYLMVKGYDLILSVK